MKTNTESFIKYSYLGHCVNDTYWFILPLLLPKILEEFGLSYGKAGGLLTVYLVIVSLFSFILGRVSDTLPKWKILNAGFFLTFFAFILAGLSSSLVFLMLFVSLGAIGVSAFHPIAYAMLDEYSPKGKARIFGHFECWGMIGLFFMFALNGILLSLFPWRTVLLATAFPSLIMGFIGLFRTAPPVKTKKTTEEPVSINPHTSPVLLLVFFLAVILRVIGVLGVLNFIPTFLMNDLAVEEHIAAFSAGFYFIGGMTGSIIGGKAGDKYGHLRILLLATMICSPVILLLGSIRTLWIIPILLLILGFSSSGISPNQNFIISKLGAGIGRGTTFGALVALLALTNAFSPLIFGASADIVGLSQTIQLFSIPMALSFLIFVGLSANSRFRRALN